ncbi:MAG: alpha-E domain-containing protein [Akkermansiaceae bacterium]
MLCRVADSLFWMSRYIERAENTVRLVDVTLQSLLETAESCDELSYKHWSPILESLGDHELFESIFPEKTSVDATYFLTFSVKNPSSVINCISYARENARMIRDQISVEMWETINRLYLFLKNTDAEKVCSELNFDFFQKIKEYTLLFQGIKEVTFNHKLGYEFLSCGYYLERADKTCRILDTKRFMNKRNVKDDGTLDSAQWTAILRASSAYDAYSQEFVRRGDHNSVTRFLMLSRDFPRSVLFCITRLQTAIHAISRCPISHYANEVERKVGMLISQLKYTDPEKLDRKQTKKLIKSIEDQLAEIAIALSDQYMFSEISDPSTELVES